MGAGHSHGAEDASPRPGARKTVKTRAAGLAECLAGHHTPCRLRAKAQGSGAMAGPRQVYCTRCGVALVKSPVTRRWRGTGLMG